MNNLYDKLDFCLKRFYYDIVIGGGVYDGIYGSIFGQANEINHWDIPMEISQKFYISQILSGHLNSKYNAILNIFAEIYEEKGFEFPEEIKNYLILE